MVFEPADDDLARDVCPSNRRHMASTPRCGNGRQCSRTVSTNVASAPAMRRVTSVPATQGRRPKWAQRRR